MGSPRGFLSDLYGVSWGYHAFVSPRASKLGIPWDFFVVPMGFPWGSNVPGGNPAWVHMGSAMGLPLGIPNGVPMGSQIGTRWEFQKDCRWVPLGFPIGIPLGSI